MRPSALATDLELIWEEVFGAQCTILAPASWCWPWPVSAADACVAVVAAVEVTGAWLIAANGAEAGHLMWVTDEVSGLLAELQMTLGEGPGPDAVASGGRCWLLIWVRGKLSTGGQCSPLRPARPGHLRLRAYAYAHDRRLSDLARDIVERRIRLRPDPDPR